MKPKIIKTTGHGMIEIDHGSGKLEKFLEQNPRAGTPKHTVKVLIEAEIDGVFGRHDGIGQEFTMSINKLDVVD